MQSQPPASRASSACPVPAENTVPRSRSLILEPEPLQEHLPQSHFSSVRNETPSEPQRGRQASQLSSRCTHSHLSFLKGSCFSKTIVSVAPLFRNQCGEKGLIKNTRRVTFRASTVGMLFWERFPLHSTNTVTKAQIILP